MFNLMKSITAGAVFTTCFLFGNTPFMELKLKQNLQFEHLTTMGFDIYIDLPKDFIENTKKQVEATSSPETLAFSLALNNLLNEQPVLSGQTQNTRFSRVLEIKPEHYIVSSYTDSMKFTFQENLLGNFSVYYNSSKPDKNFSNLPIPFDFSAIDRELKEQSHLIMQIGKDGTLENVNNLNQLLYRNAIENQAQFTSDQITQLVQVIELISDAITQIKAPSYLTYIHLPSSPKKVGESWENPYLTIPNEWKALLPEEILPALSIVGQKLTLIERKNGIATIKIEMPVEDSLNLTLEEGVDLAIEGSLMKGVLKIDETTGVVMDAELLTDYSIKFSKVKGKQSPLLSEMPDYLIIRLVATLGVEAKPKF